MTKYWKPPKFQLVLVRQLTQTHSIIAWP